MKKSTKIIGVAILLATGLGVWLINRKSASTQAGLLPDNPENGSVFNPKLIASQLFEAMRLTLRTDEDAIWEALGSVTQNQFALVVKSFGLRPYNKLTGNTVGVWGIDLPKLGLKDWLKQELSTKLYNELRYKYPKYL